MTDPIRLFAMLDQSTDTQDTYTGLPVAMAYVPNQQNLDTFETMQGFKKGTLFTVLEKPFTAGDRA